MRRILKLALAGEIKPKLMKGLISMEKKIFKVARIEGEYAYLKDINDPSGEELFIALALLPFGVDIGKTLEYESFSFTLLD